jgi:hypothetical protein
VQLLATPSKIADTSWIKPGKSAWDWWNGWAVNVPDAGINTASYKAYIDFAKSMDLDYILIDEGWYKGSSEGAQPADVTVPVAAMDMPGIVKYGADRHVGVWVWLQWKQLERQMDAALALYEAWGIKGIKVDFMDRNDQQMVAFYHELLSKAAAHHLMVDLHGAYPPDGLARTAQFPDSGRRAGGGIQQVRHAHHRHPQCDAAFHAHAVGPHGLYARRLPRFAACRDGPAAPLSPAFRADHARAGAGDVCRL